MSSAIDWSLDPRLRGVLGRLPLPIKLPTPLQRGQLGDGDRPLAGKRALLTRLSDATDLALALELLRQGASLLAVESSPAPGMAEAVTAAGGRLASWSGDLAQVVAHAAARMDRRPLLVVDRLRLPQMGDVAVNDATDRLHQVGQTVCRAPQGSRWLLLCDAELGQIPAGRLLAAAALGCMRSVHKELGPAGSTAHRLTLAGAEPQAVADAVAFLLGPRAAFLTGLDLTLTAQRPTVAAGGPSWNPKQLQGKVALVTGAARGIGAAVALRLAQAGAEVWVNDVAQAEEAGSATVARLREGGAEAHFVAADCADPRGAAAIAQALQRGGRLDVVVHNAGITRDRTLKKLDLASWRKVLAVDLGSMIEVQRAIQPLMIPGSSAVLLSSVMGIAGNFGQTNYTAAKAAVIELARIWSEEWQDSGMRANAIAPGFILTEMTAHLPLLNKEMAKQLSSLLQPGLPLDVAELALFLGSAESRALSGQVLRCDGGMAFGA